MTDKQGFLATFRIDKKIWEKFREIAQRNQTNASALLIRYIQGVVAEGDIPQPPLPHPQSSQTVDITNLDDIYTYIDNKLDKDVDDAAKKLIAESLEDGEIGEAIAKSYAAMMGQFNELLHQMEDLKAAIPPVVAPSPQLPMTNDQSPITNDQSPITNDQSLIPNNQPPIEKSKIENIRTTLRRNGISTSTEQIRSAFLAAGWDGSNYQEIRKIILEILS